LDILRNLNPALDIAVDKGAEDDSPTLQSDTGS